MMQIFQKIGWLIVIVIVAAILRVWDFVTRLHFELDQARDVFVVYDALEKGVLPLLGPMARGSDLFLGPVFYYFQILSGWLFGVTPVTMTFPDVVFGIGAIVLTYFFLGRFFSLTTTVIVTSLVATSLYAITYGTFAWNPNGMFFWALVFAYASTLFVDVEESWRQYVLAGIIGMSVGVLMQLHYIAFFVVPLICVGYVLFMRIKLSWRVVIIGCACALLVSTPVLVHEATTAGKNTRAIISTVKDKGSKDDEHNLVEKMFRAGQSTSAYFVVSMVSDQHGRDLVRTKTKNGWQLICDEACKKRLPFLIGEGLFFLIVLVMFIRARTWLAPAVWRLMIVWSIAASIFLVFLAYQISPRFYLVLMPVFLIGWAIFFETLLGFMQKRWVIGLGAILIAFNIGMVIMDYRIVQDVQHEAIESPRDIIMQRSDRITLTQLRQAADFIDREYEGKEYIIVGDNRYARAMYYLTHIEKGHENAVCYTKRGGMTKGGYGGYPLFALMRTGSSVQIPEHLLDGYDVVHQENIGTIMIYKLIPKVQGGDYKYPQDNCYVR